MRSQRLPAFFRFFQVPRSFGVCYGGFPAFWARSTCLKTAKLRRLGFCKQRSRSQSRKQDTYPAYDSVASDQVKTRLSELEAEAAD